MCYCEDEACGDQEYRHQLQKWRFPATGWKNRDKLLKEMDKVLLKF